MILLKNIIYQVLGKAITIFATAIGISLITKALGVEFYGQYVYVITFLTIFFTFSDWGINTIVIKEISDQKEISKEYFSKVLVTRVLFAFLMCVFAVLVAFLFQFEKALFLSVLVGLPMIVSYSISSTSSIIFASKFKYRLDLIVKSAYSIISLSVLYLILGNVTSVWAVVLASVLGWGVSSIFSLFFVRQYLQFRFLKIDYQFSKKLVLISLPIGVALIINTLLSQIDKLIIPHLLDFRQAGFYALSYKVFEFLLVLPTFFINSVFILLANKKHNLKIFDNSLKIFVFVSVVLSFFCIYFAPAIIDLISGKDFSFSILPFQVLSFSLIVFFISALLRLQLIVEGKEKLFFYIYLSSLVLNVILNIILLPVMGIVGAAFATILSELLVLILMVKEVGITVISRSNLFYLNKVVLVCSLSFLPIVLVDFENDLVKFLIPIIFLILFSYALGLTNELLKLVKSIEEKIVS